MGDDTEAKGIQAGIREELRRVLPGFVRAFIARGLDLVVPSRRAQRVLTARWRAELAEAEQECRQLAPVLFGPGARRFEDRLELLAHSVAEASRQEDGLWLEFGVYRGETLNLIAAGTEATVFGFDSFRGLPEDWRVGESNVTKAGTFALPSPPTVRRNARLVPGRFEETLPGFRKAHPGPVAFAHIDCVLYSSTRCILQHLNVRPGTILVFDEYYNFPRWRDGEYRAFQEFLAGEGREAECIGYASRGWNAAFKLK